MTDILEVRGLSYGHSEQRSVFQKAREGFQVRDFHLSLRAGDMHALIGESGAGKSTLARLLAGALKPAEGLILWRGRPLTSYSLRERARGIQLVMQDATEALHARRTVGEQLREVARVTRGLSPSQVRDMIPQRCLELHLDPLLLERFPHELSGGQRQRVNLLRALLCEPELLICDEPLSALDRLHQVELLEILQEWRQRTGGAIVLIAHDVNVVAQWSDAVSLLYQGRCLEQGPSKAVLQRPQHPYTRWLLSAQPRLYRPAWALARSELVSREERPGVVVYPSCPWVKRCALAEPACWGQESRLKRQDVDSSHQSACIRSEDLPWHVGS